MPVDQDIGDDGASAVTSMFAVDVDLFRRILLDHRHEFVGIWKFAAERDVNLSEAEFLHGILHVCQI